MAIRSIKKKPNVLLLENIHPDAEALFTRAGYIVESLSRSLLEAELIEKLKDIIIFGVRSKTRITKKLIESAPNLLAIGAFCIGTDQIDVAACAEQGVIVFNAPYSNTRSVVELALGEIIMLIRGIFDQSSKLHHGVWDKSSSGSLEVRGKKLGIVGYGNIGSQLSILAEGLGMEVYYYDVLDKLALGNAKRCALLHNLLNIVDIVTIHVDGNPWNKNLIGEKEFQAMKKGAIFLNLSRGFVVDIKALVKYIKNGTVKGAGVDVYPDEPHGGDTKFISELQKLPNVILTPHIGGSTEEAQQNIASYTFEKITRYLENGSSVLSVNFPGVQLPEAGTAHRFISIHKNIPGMLAKINTTLAKNNINIEGQYLKTNDHIGYVITDVNKRYNYNKEVIKKLERIPGTIKFRVL